MIAATIGGPTNRGVLFLAALILLLFGAIRRNPRDRVLLFQTLAFVSVIGAGVVIVWADLSGSALVLALIPFVSFMFLACYFAFVNRLRRRKRES
jgi:hypothetical protein